ncbi:P-loop containing nucleoside triphosphate hydrolase protein [Mycena polygramma]|nr:P-loop containing nucleoside triphosphate hydrolase protein [Mycena polygramma]
MAREHDHVKRTAESQRVLQEAREKARQKSGYDSEATRRDLARLFEERFKKPGYDWQIDVTEAFTLGLNVVLIAGTGAGKTIPFMMPLLLKRERYSLVISPLKILQEDQAKRFEKIGLKATAVNGDTYSRELQKELDQQMLNAVFTSPEMCLEHEAFRKWLQDPVTGQRALGTIIDEAHCASQWGGDFRPHYGQLNRLRAILPVGAPILAASATLSPSALKDLCSGLDLDLDEAFYLNLGNDCPNITPSVVEMNGAKDYDAVFPHLPNPCDVHSVADLPKGAIFMNAVKKTQIMTKRLRRRYPNIPASAIDFLHSHRTAKAKRRVMRDFRKGKIKLLVATEAAGMGADISDIELIIQFGVPSSLAVWTQRAGRAGRDPSLQARAILLYEKSMFMRKKKRKRKGNPTTPSAPAPPEPDASDSESSSDSDDEFGFGAADGGIYSKDHVKEPNDGKEWGKVVDPVIRQYIQTKLCRRDVTDRPIRSSNQYSAPTGDCCDNCVRNATPSTADSPRSDAQPRSTTPERNAEPSSAHSTPSKDKNANGKRRMVRGDPKTRRGEHREAAQEALQRWRLRTYLEKYSKSSLPEVGIMSDTILATLATKRLKTVAEMLELRPSWILARRHGEDVLAVLRRVDERVQAEKQRTNEAANTARKALTAARRAAVATKPPKLPRSRVARRQALAAMSPNLSVRFTLPFTACFDFFLL